ncbi:MAG: prepilin-type N-terminal cleavage/methylation domain-containing protein [Candidatus Woesebacteria bacterium]|jgi:prepilin-type N-terminal cleavage/methylation domain-containing protein
MKGFTLIELLVVVVIITIITLGGYENIVGFQKGVVLDQTTSEFVNTLRHARNKSISGEIEEGKTHANYDEDFLPRYGVGVDATQDKYYLFVNYQEAGVESTVIQEEYELSQPLEISPDTQVYFERITGNSAAASITITDIKSAETRTISITSAGEIEEI